MLKAACSLTGLRKLKNFAEPDVCNKYCDRTRWIEAFKIWGIRRQDLAVEMVVDDVADMNVLPLMTTSNLTLQEMDLARKVVDKLSSRNMVEAHRRFATTVFGGLSETLRKYLMDIMVELKAQNVAGWLPGDPETMV
jgi:hypothetical protein